MNNSDTLLPLERGRAEALRIYFGRLKVFAFIVFLNVVALLILIPLTSVMTGVSPTPTKTMAPPTATPSGEGITLQTSVDDTRVLYNQPITWTFIVQNTTGSAIDNISVTNAFAVITPSLDALLSARVLTGIGVRSKLTSQGEFTITSPYRFNWDVGTLQPKQSASLIIIVFFNQSVWDAAPFTLGSNATVMAGDGFSAATAQSSVYIFRLVPVGPGTSRNANSDGLLITLGLALLLASLLLGTRSLVNRSKDKKKR